MENLKVINNLRFKDSRDQAFCNFSVNRFVKKHINTDLYAKVEISKDCIYLFKHGESGFSHFIISGFQPKTAREMIIFISGVNYVQ